MKLLALKLENFKGIGKFELIANGCNADIYGDNATGKTTIFDAFIWLLFDKDSENRKDFNIKFVDESGDPVHHLEHSVTGTFSIGTKTITLQKIFKERWVRSRGQAVEKFSGHKTEYAVNGIPCTKTEYDQAIKDIADEKVFRLVTDPLYANEQLPWQELRNIVMEVCGEVSDEEVCFSDDSLTTLFEWIKQGNKIEDLKKVSQAKQRKINDELKLIPARISELSKMEPPAGKTEKELLEIIDRLKKTVADKNSKLSMIVNSGAAAEWKLRIAELKAQEKTELSAANEEITIRKDRIQKQIAKIQGDIANANNDCFMAESQVKSLKTSIDGKEKELDYLRDKGRNAIGKEFVHEEIKCTCPVCNQNLPEEQIQAAKDNLEKLREAFNLEKSETIAAINSKGKALKADLEADKGKLEKLQAKSKEFSQLVQELRENLSAEKVKLELIKEVTDNDSLAAIRNNILELENKINTASESSQTETASIKKEIGGIEIEIEKAQEEIAGIRQYEKTKDRIAELKSSQEKLAAEYEEWSGKIYCMEQFTVKKIELMQERINSKFKLARFKMYAENITNDGIAECCETTLNGVPYKDLNNAAKINVGLDIIETLSDYYGFKAPIFVDNAEAVTSLTDMGNTQIIRLVVSEQDKALRVVSKDIELKEAI